MLLKNFLMAGQTANKVNKPKVRSSPGVSSAALGLVKLAAKISMLKTATRTIIAKMVFIMMNCATKFGSNESLNKVEFRRRNCELYSPKYRECRVTTGSK